MPLPTIAVQGKRDVTWIDNLRTRGGPLVDPAERLLRSERQCLGDAFDGGPEGIVALASALEAWTERDNVDEAQEARFVEGAGALLGLILIDHVARARHAARGGVHRVQLGRHGFFDPFRAIEHALDARDVRRELAREVARAEAEAAGRGPLSRVVAALHQVLSEQRPDLGVVAQFETRVQLSDGSEIDLARVVRATVGEPEAHLRAAVVRLVELLPGQGRARGPAWAQLAPRLLPRLARADTLHALNSHGRGQLWSRPWLEDLHVALALQHEDRARYARVDEVDAWIAQGARPWVQALENLAQRSGAARWARIDSPLGPMVVSRSGDGLDSARALLPGLFDVLCGELGPRIGFAVPHRDLLLACPANRPSLRARLLARAQRDHARAPHRLSSRLFVLDEAGPRGCRE